MSTPQALVVRGGWDGHRPVEATDMYIPFLEASGFTVRVEESNEVYADDFPNVIGGREMPARFHKALAALTPGQKFPLILTSGRLVEYEGGGDETRSNRYLAEVDYGRKAIALHRRSQKRVVEPTPSPSS